jgi:hypothetical protein
MPDNLRDEFLRPTPCLPQNDGSVYRFLEPIGPEYLEKMGVDDVTVAIHDFPADRSAEAVVQVTPKGQNVAQIVDLALEHTQLALTKEKDALRFPYVFDDRKAEIAGQVNGQPGQTIAVNTPRWHYGDALYGRVLTATRAQGHTGVIQNSNLIEFGRSCTPDEPVAPQQKLASYGDFDAATRVLENVINMDPRSPYMASWIGVQLSKAINAAKRGDEKMVRDELSDAQWGAQQRGDATAEMALRKFLEQSGEVASAEEIESISGIGRYLGSARKLGVTPEVVAFHLDWNQ